MRRLKSHDYYQQVGESVKMRMLPCCPKPECGRDTDFSDECCRKCGASTKDRMKVAVLDTGTGRGRPKCDAEGKPTYHSEHASLSEADVRKEVLGLCEPPLTPEQAAAFYVSFVAQHGQSVVAHLGRAPARPLCPLRARLAAFGSLVLPE